MAFVFNKFDVQANLSKTYQIFMDYVYEDISVAYRITSFFRARPPTQSFEEEYIKMVQGCIQSTNKILATQKNSNFRSLISSADGTVAFDSAKCVFTNGKITGRGLNTYKNFLEGTIDVNHNTRPEIIGALMGTTTESQYTTYRISSTVGSWNTYFAVRQGTSFSIPFCVVRISFPRYVQEKLK